MQEIQDRACHAANRIDVAVGFVTGASTENRVVSCILDTFRVMQDLLMDISQTGQRDEFVRFLAGGHDLLDQSSEEAWSEFVVSQINLWHAAKLNQKSIAILGDHLSSWTPSPVDANEFDDALQHLDFLAMYDPESVANAWSSEPDLDKRMQALSICIAGIAVIASNNTVMDTTEAYTGASFGASLLLKNAATFLA